MVGQLGQRHQVGLDGDWLAKRAQHRLAASEIELAPTAKDALLLLVLQIRQQRQAFIIQPAEGLIYSP